MVRIREAWPVERVSVSQTDELEKVPVLASQEWHHVLTELPAFSGETRKLK